MECESFSFAEIAFPALHGAVDPAVVQRAAMWMVRLWSDEASEEDRAACAHWRGEHPNHELAWRRLQAFDDKHDGVPRELTRHALRGSEAAPGRRRALYLLGLALTVGGLACVTRGSETWHMATAGHSTATGEIREITLPDGTRIELGCASAIDLHFDARERRVTLRAGEILVPRPPTPPPCTDPSACRAATASCRRWAFLAEAGRWQLARGGVRRRGRSAARVGAGPGRAGAIPPWPGCR